MKVILIYMAELLHCPPAMSLGNVLNSLNCETYFFTFEDRSENFTNYFKNLENVNFINMGKSNVNASNVKKLFSLITLRKKIWYFINKIRDKNTVIWVLSNGSLKYLGKNILKTKYILHLLELTEELYLIESKHLIPLSRLYSEKATAIIECEYNRAHITKAWWRLNKLPYVLENKPFLDYPINKNSKILFDDKINDLFNRIKNKKIIMYQGNISKERPLEPFVEAVSELGEEWAFVAMVNGDNPISKKISNYYYLNFVIPPNHLIITSHAYIGVISYTPVINSYSILNTLYCAPNKIWEYSKFGIPIISNDMPALKWHFDYYKDGVCIKSLEKNEIKKAILEIEKNYEFYSNNSKNFYSSCDVRAIVKEILESVELK